MFDTSALVFINEPKEVGRNVSKAMCALHLPFVLHKQ